MRLRASVAAASWLTLALTALLPALPATAQQLGDFGRLQPGFVNDEIVPMLDRSRRGTNGKPLGGMNVTDEESEMRDRVWRFLVAPHVRDWAWPYGAEIRPARAGGDTARQLGKYYRWLSGEHYASSHARYSTIADHVGADIGTLPATFRSICTVIDIDRQRGVAVAELSDLEPALLAKVDQRDRDNGAFVGNFILALNFRYESYQYALDRLLVETPHREAVKVDLALGALAPWVDRANAHDFCVEAEWSGGDSDQALPSRMLLDAPDEGAYRK